MSLPSHAISIRQPWAWLIVNGHKDIENRTWRTNFRGPVLIHASAGTARSEYAAAEKIARAEGITMPRAEDLERGGIVGMVTIAGCVDDSHSPWFFGPRGFILEEASPLPFMPLKGALGFFKVDGGKR